MEIDKVNEDDVILATCTYCGTQTRVNTRTLEADKPVTCRECGARLEIDSLDPWERRIRGRSKLVKCERCGALTEMRNTYYVDGMRYCARCNELSHAERGGRQAGITAIIVSIGIVLVIVVLILLMGKC